MAAKKTKKKKGLRSISDVFIQSGTDRTCYVTFTASDKSKHIDHFEVEWQYATGNAKKDGSKNIGNTSYWNEDAIKQNYGNLRWFAGTKSDSPASTPTKANKYISSGQSVYTVPGEAIAVRVRATPISKTYRKDNKEHTHFDPKYSSYKYRSFANYPTLSVPPTPTVTLNGLTITAKVENYSDANAGKIIFEVVQDDTTAVKSAPVTLTTTSATFVSETGAKYIVEGHRYKVRCRAKTSDDKYQSAYSDYSSNVETRPAGPSKVNLKALTESSVEASWPPVTNATSYVLRYAPSKRMFETDDAQSVEKTTLAAQITGLETGKTWYFRLFSKNSSGLESSTFAESSIIIGTAPSAPTTWSLTSTAMVDTEAVLYWQHNSEDGSKEESARLKLEAYAPGIDQSGSPSYSQIITKTASADQETFSSFTFTPGSGTTPSFSPQLSDGWAVYWSVSTKGAYPEYSPYSTRKKIDIYAKPGLTVSLKKDLSDAGLDLSVEPLTSYPFYLVADVSNSAASVISYNIEIMSVNRNIVVDNTGRNRIIGENERIFSEVIIPEDGTVHHLERMFSAGDLLLSLSNHYRINVSVAMSNGTSAETSADFVTDFPGLDEIEIDAVIEFDYDNYTTSIAPYATVDLEGDEEEDEVEYISTKRLAVYRIEYDGRLTLIADDLENDGTTFVTDPHPPLNNVRYRIVATDQETGGVLFEDVELEDIGVTSIVIQWDENWGNYNVYEDEDGEDLVEPSWSGHILVLPYNVKTSESNSIDVEFANYIGRSHPVSYYGTQLGVKSSWSSDIPKTDTETLFMIRQLSVYMGNVYVREPSGVGYWAQASVSYNRGYDSVLIPVSIDITRVDGGA